MRGLMEGLQSPLLIIADIHNDRSRLHRPYHLSRNQILRISLRPLHAVEHHIGLRQDLADILPVGNHSIDVLPVLILQAP
ncbi:hypothetical protein SDC9_184070 [bioreactor metagenome]|uniref:Uncharacterized protein n=1 Tax=bioreactor metagenome TaxID=1076179 RepID=A0A645HBZ6_9ZZZZ